MFDGYVFPLFEEILREREQFKLLLFSTTGSHKTKANINIMYCLKYYCYRCLEVVCFITHMLKAKQTSASEVFRINI